MKAFQATLQTQVGPHVWECRQRGGSQGPHLQKPRSTPQTVSENTNGDIKQQQVFDEVNVSPGVYTHFPLLYFILRYGLLFSGVRLLRLCSKLSRCALLSWLALLLAVFLLLACSAI